MKSATRLLVLGVLLTCASSIAVVKLRAQAAPAPGRVCEGPDLRAHVAADPRRVAVANARISLVPPEGLSVVTDTSFEPTLNHPLTLLNPDSTARIWLQYVPGRRLDESGVRAWLSTLERQSTQIYRGASWIARDASALDETSWRIRLELTGVRDGVPEHAWIWAAPFEATTLIAVFAAPVGDPRWTEAMERSVATLEVRDCTLRWPLATFVDSAALVRAVSGLPAPGDLPAGVTPLFWVGFDSAGPGVRVTPLFDETPESYAGPVEAAIRAHLKPRPPFLPDDRSFTLRVVAGPQPLVDNPEVVAHAPALRPGERARLGVELNRLPRPPRDSLRAHGGRLDYLVGLRVQADGTVDSTSVVLKRSPGFPQLDARVLLVVRTMRFRPATFDGVPQAVLVTLPIVIEP
jgi:TonB family protein